MSIALTKLNEIDQPEFVRKLGNIFEHSPWVAQRAWNRRPFQSLQDLNQKMSETMLQAKESEKLALIQAHPDLVGRLAQEGRLTPESTREQIAAGLAQLTRAEADTFERYNAQYRERFGFPFIICARENKKQAILAAFPVRLTHARDEEIAAALAEISQIARFRLLDAVSE